MTTTSEFRRGVAAAALGLGLAAAAGTAARAQACTSPVCLAPAAQSTTFVVPGRAPDGTIVPRIGRVSSTATYQPISIWNMGGGNFDVAFTFPLVPVAVTFPADTNGPPINFRTVLGRPWGGYIGTPVAPVTWTYASFADALPNEALNVTAYQVYAGPNYVGIRSDPTRNGFTSGFAVQAPENPPGIAPGTAHWVQVIADNYNISNNPGFGNPENILDNGGVNFGGGGAMPPVTSPYYDAVGAAGATSFYDAPRRDNQANLNQSNWWLADLFLATGPGPTGQLSRGAAPGTVTFENPGIQYGWGNFHLQLGGIFGLRQLFAQDTSSVQNFELALDCDPTTCPLSTFVTQTYLNELDADFNAIPEPGTWAVMALGAGLTGAALRRRRRLVTAA
jgi:hypothetical protein